MASSNYTSCHICSKHGVLLVCVKQLYASFNVIVDVSYQMKEFTPSTLRGNYHKPPFVCKQNCCQVTPTLLSLSNKGCGPYQWNSCRMKDQRRSTLDYMDLTSCLGPAFGGLRLATVNLCLNYQKLKPVVLLANSNTWLATISQLPKLSQHFQLYILMISYK